MSDVAVRDTRTPAQILTAQVRSPEFTEQAAMVLPDNVPPSRFVRSTVTALMQNPKLAELEPDSLFASLFKAAQDGLLPDGREAAIVAHGNKATYLPMIGGVIKIAAEHGWSMTTRVVYANDAFDYELGLNERIDHKPAAGERGDRIYAYAIARHRDGRPPLVEVMDAAEVEKVKSVSRASSRGPWVDWTDRMWEKSVGHRLFKRLPLDPGDKRVARIALDAEEIGPAASAAMLYGPSGQAFQAREITAGEDSSQGATDGGPEASADQQAGDEQPVMAPAAPPAPGPAKANAAAVKKAGETRVPRLALAPDAPDMTLAEILADSEYADEWFGWALAQPLVGEPEFKAALELFARAKKPDVWTAVRGAA